MTKLFGYTNYWAVSGWVGFIFVLFIFWPDTASAQTVFKSIVDIPGITGEPDATENFGIYINALYVFAITVGAMLAVLKLVAAGVKYMFSDIVTNKEAAKSDIKGAILGLLIVIGAVVILNTVNTDLTNVNLDLAAVETDTTDRLRAELERLQNLMANCHPEDGCIISVMGRDQCRDASVNGTVIAGNIIAWGLGGNYNDRCIHISRGPTESECQEGEIHIITPIPGGVERSCVPRDQVEVPPSGEEINITEFEIRANLLTHLGYTLVPGGHSDRDQYDPRSPDQNFTNCTNAGGDYYLLTRSTDGLTLVCWKKP